MNTQHVKYLLLSQLFVSLFLNGRDFLAAILHKKIHMELVSASKRFKAASQLPKLPSGVP